jgi:class 3 adenylate cyclase
MRSSLLSVMVCASCGHENSDAARFCEACAAALGGGSGERRKVVSVLFCDVVGSTALGELLDPEALRALLARYFDRMRGPLRITAVRWRSSSAMR